MIVKKLERMLADAREKRSWGEIAITLKEGVPQVIRLTIQEKVEDTPANDYRK